jgi:hypothetical protein
VCYWYFMDLCKEKCPELSHFIVQMIKRKWENVSQICILNNIVSKVFERVVCDQVNSYISEHNHLYDYQSCVKNRFSTDTSVTQLTVYENR